MPWLRNCSIVLSSIATLSLLVAVTGCSLHGRASGGAHTTTVFSGAKVNAGTATHTRQGDQSIVTLSDDFVVPETPAPHWQVVDSDGNAYLLQRLKIKNDGFNKSIVVPAYVPNLAKVQIWCAWAETLLGEASFDRPVQ